MDSSHVNWFNSLFDDFKQQIAKGEGSGARRMRPSARQLIHTAYASAKEGRASYRSRSPTVKS